MFSLLSDAESTLTGQLSTLELMESLTQCDLIATTVFLDMHGMNSAGMFAAKH